MIHININKLVLECHQLVILIEKIKLRLGKISNIDVFSLDHFGVTCNFYDEPWEEQKAVIT